MSERKKVVRRPVPTRPVPPSPESRHTKELDGGLFQAAGRAEVVLGIDQSYSGFAVTAMTMHGDPLYYSWCYKAPGTGVFRLLAIDVFLYRVLERLTDEGRPVRAVAMEGYAYSTTMAHMAGELGATVKICLANYYGTESPTSPGFPLIVPPTSLKKYVVGRGTKVAKQHILLGVYKKWGQEFRDDNMADAYVMARIARERDTTEGLLQYELEVLAKLREPKHREVAEAV